MSVGVRLCHLADQAIIAAGLPFLGLLRLDDAKQPNGDQRSHRQILVRKHQNVDRITILRARAGHETERERERHAGWKHPGQLEQTGFRIIVEFGSVPPWRLDDRSARQCLIVEVMRQSEKVGHIVFIKGGKSGASGYRAGALRLTSSLLPSPWALQHPRRLRLPRLHRRPHPRSSQG